MALNLNERAKEIKAYQRYTLHSYNATIYCGLREGYNGKLHTIREANEILYKFCSAVGFCVTSTPTKFVYRGGIESGVIVGIISYPRYPKMPAELKETAIRIAQMLKDCFKQNRVTIVCTDETIMLGSKE